jgi:hypothetical protein
MVRFIIKTHKLDDDKESSVAGTSSGSITHSTVSVSSTTIVCQYNEDYLSFKLISFGEQQPCPKCVVCGEKLANQAMVPSKLKRHFHIKHSHLCKKPAKYFKRLTAAQTCQAMQWTKITIISDKVHETSDAIVEIMAKKMKSRRIAELVILPACCKIVNIMLGEEYEKGILKIPVR